MASSPSLQGFIAFVRGVMGVPESAIADDNPTLECCYESALELLPDDMGLQLLPIIWTNTVYNAGASLLINFAIDTPPSTYWTNLRKKLGIGKLVTGLMNSASDQGTSGSMEISDAMKGLSLADLMMLQDPYGREVIAVLMELGPHWGYTP